MAASVLNSHCLRVGGDVPENGLLTTLDGPSPFGGGGGWGDNTVLLITLCQLLLLSTSSCSYYSPGITKGGSRHIPDAIGVLGAVLDETKVFVPKLTRTLALKCVS